MRIVYMGLDELKRAPRNAKDHELPEIAASMGRFGFVSPLILDERTGCLVAGHGRLDTLLSLYERGEDPPKRVKVQKGRGGLLRWRVPVLRGISFANDEEAEAYVLADNQLVIAGGYNPELLPQMVGAAAEGAGLEGTGFSMGDAQEMVSKLTELGPPSTPGADDAGPAKGEGGPASPLKGEAARVYGGATSLTRTSRAVTHWRKLGLLEGQVLDFGSGKEAHAFAKFDAFHRPDTAPLLETYDVVMCNYVLNVQPSDHLVVLLLALLSRLVRPRGKVLIATPILKLDCGRHESVKGVQVVRTSIDWRRDLELFFDVREEHGAGLLGFVCSSRVRSRRRS